MAFGTTLANAGPRAWTSTPAAVITPDAWAEVDDVDPVEVVRKVTYTLTLAVRDDDPASRFDALDRLTSLAAERDRRVATSVGRVSARPDPVAAGSVRPDVEVPGAGRHPPRRVHVPDPVPDGPRPELSNEQDTTQMSATKRFMNWTGVTFTPANGAPIADHRGDVDPDRFRREPAKVLRRRGPLQHHRRQRLQRPDRHRAFGRPGRRCKSFPVGTVGIFTATHNDARNGAGAGRHHLRPEQRGGREQPGPRHAPSVRPGRADPGLVLARRGDQPALHHQHDA